MKRPSFLNLPKPIVACILSERTIADAVATIKNGEFEGAPAFAVHMEALGKANLTDENLLRIIQATKRPVMMLHYRPNPCPFTEEERVELLLRCAKHGAAAIDFTADTFDPSPMEFSDKPDAVDKQRRAIDQAHALGAEVVMSSHIYEPRTCEQVLEQMKAMEKRGVDFAKIVTITDTEEDFLEAVKTTLALRREMKIPFIHLCGGKFGLAHRFLSPKLGNAVTFCVSRYTECFTTIQPHLTNMLTVLDKNPWHIDLYE